MAKSKGNDKEEKFKFPSHFGSHASMIVAEETEKLADEKLVCLKDEHGTYVTERNRLDNKEADPNRYVTARLNKLFARKEEKKSQ
jgi:hypothetical protein